MKYWFMKTKEEAKNNIALLNNDRLTINFVDTRIACEVNNNFLIISNHK